MSQLVKVGRKGKRQRREGELLFFHRFSTRGTYSRNHCVFQQASGSDDEASEEDAARTVVPLILNKSSVSDFDMFSEHYYVSIGV